MKKVILLIVAFLALNVIYAQCDTTLFRYTGTFIKDLSLLDTNRMLAVGDNGYIIKSADGGKSWKNIQTFQYNVLNGIQMTSDSVGYVVGDYKTILKTENGGESWYPLYAIIKSYSNSYSSFNDLFFFDHNRGFIVGGDGILLSTVDGGRSWKDTSFEYSENLTSITFVNDSLGFICGNDAKIYRTTNGGHTWQITYDQSSNSIYSLTKIRFIDSTTGFAVGYSGTCIKTTDGGLTWSNINTPTSGDYFDIFFIDAKKGFIVGNYASGLILQTSDGGNTWDPDFNNPGRNASYYCINADPKKEKIIIAGGGQFSEFEGYNGRNILSTNDSGATYTLLSRNGRLQYYDAFFLNDSTGYIAGEEDNIFRTSDYGESWKPLQNVPTTASNSPVQKTFFLDSIYGFAGTDNIFKTNDGGNTWIQTQTPGTQSLYFPKQMYFFDSLTGIVQDAGTMYKTTNAGDKWTNVLNSSFLFTDFTFTPRGRGAAVGYSGEAYMSTDKGSNWDTLDLNTTEDLTSVYFFNNQLGFIGTSDSILFRTTDGGSTWNRLNIGSFPVHMWSFLFTNDSVGYMIRNSKQGLSWMYKTTDGGISWNYLREQTEDLTRLTGFKTIYTAGGNGLILKSDTLQRPGVPGYIYGPDKSCTNQKASYITGNMTGVNYTWTLSGGGTNTYEGAMDTVFWNTPGSYSLSVAASNACGSGLARQAATIDVIDFKPAITATDSVLTATEGTSYQWYLNGRSVPDSSGGKARSVIAKTTGDYSVTVTSLYGCTVTSSPYHYQAVLPVQLISLQASLNSFKTVDISWTTANESGTKYYVIERKNENGVFKALDTVVAAGQGSLSYTYAAKDVSPGVGVNYYRLQIADADGKMSYSAIVLVNVWQGNHPVLFPNPVSTSIFTILKGRSSITKVVMYDQALKVVAVVMNTLGNNTVTIPVGAISNGTYIVQIYTTDAVFTDRVIVSR